MKDDVPQCRQPSAQLADHGASVNIAPAIGHAIHREQHFGFNLLEAVQHGAGSHVGCADAPNAANTHGGEKGDDGLGDIRQVSRHPVAWLHPLRPQVQC